MSETAQILPDNYYQILLKIRVVGEDERLPEHCPDALQSLIYMLSTKSPIFVDRTHKSGFLSTERCVFMDR